MITLLDSESPVSIKEFFLRDKKILISELERILLESEQYSKIPQKWCNTIYRHIYSEEENSCLKQIDIDLSSISIDSDTLMNKFFSLSKEEKFVFYNISLYNFYISKSDGLHSLQIDLRRLIKVLKSKSASRLHYHENNKTFNNKYIIIYDSQFNWKKYKDTLVTCEIDYQNNLFCNSNLELILNILGVQIKIMKPVINLGKFYPLKQAELHTLQNSDKFMRFIETNFASIKNIPPSIQNFLLLK